MILVSVHVNYVQHMCAIPMPEYTFLTLPFSPRGCRETQKWRSRPPCRSLFFVLGALGARHNFGFCNTSRVQMLVLRMPVANVLLALRFFTSSMHSELVENMSSNSNGEPRTILMLFSRTRFYSAMSLPPKPQPPFFSFATIVLAQKRASRVRGVENINFVVPALVAAHIFLLLPPSLPFTILVFQPL